MSIYGTWLFLDDDSHEVGECARWRQVPESQAVTAPGWAQAGDTYWVQDRTVTCTCGEKGPLIYRGSHVLPKEEDRRGGSVEIGAIPNHCGNPDTDCGGPPVDYLRLSVSEHPDTYHGMKPGDATVVLDRVRAEQIRDTLTQWLDEDRGC